MAHWSNKITGLLIVSVFLLCTACERDWQSAQHNSENRVVVATMGASLMYDGNGWVEKACKQLNAECLNKAVCSKLVYDFAYSLWQDTYASDYELQKTDILLIQFANCGDVYGENDRKYPKAEDYTTGFVNTGSTDSQKANNPFRQYTNAQCMDYILKRWQQICEQNNHPMHVLLVTHWHDARTVYNQSVRELANFWGMEVVELDTNIGFTRLQPDPDGSQPSIKYAKDTEVINGVTYGWHPLRGEAGEYIQNKMAEILYEKLDEYITTNDIH